MLGFVALLLFPRRLQTQQCLMSRSMRLAEKRFEGDFDLLCESSGQPDWCYIRRNLISVEARGTSRRSLRSEGSEGVSPKNYNMSDSPSAEVKPQHLSNLQHTWTSYFNSIPLE